ncbi:arylesterase [Niastella vici]|uniref:Arylesterase n=1 Tax=Niastella vici TaxID=1703345 RepID=A0A1V9FZ49_9BACT|nr:arylesterase [Niastella vici]OQP63548.1 arylesterase [Niastella vici]
MKQFSSIFYIGGKFIVGSVLIMALLTRCGSNEEKTNDAAKQKREQLPATTNKAKAKTIVFFGNSLTAGYGVDPSEAFPALIQEKLDSLQLPYKVINAGLSGETTAGGKNRIDWILRQPVNIFVLELGGNDGLRGIPIAETSRNLQAIVTRVKEKYPEVRIILAGMQVPPNMGRNYATAFRVAFQQLAANNNLELIPFLLENVGGISALNQGDGIHPNPEGHKIVAENVWRVLKGLL